MAPPPDPAPEPLEEHRPQLLAVGYRLTGSWADAEDAVQDAWLRWERLGADGRAAVRDVRAWLATTVARLCLDRVRSAPARRETYVGPWLPEPLVASGADAVLDAVVAAADVRMATMLVLEHLTPDQRVALVLHDGVGLGFDEVGAVLGTTAPTARQLAHRGRARVRAAAREGELPVPAAGPEQRRVLDAFLAALAAADVPTLIAVLHPDVALRTDGGGVVKAARRVVRGADKVARLLVALLEEAGPELLADARPVTVNGEVGMLLPATPPMVAVLTVADGRAVGVHVVLTPEKLRS